MKHATVLALALIVALALPVAADTVQLNFTGPAGPSLGGVYTYPYNFTIGTSSTIVQLMCDSFTYEVSAPETWTASVSPLLTIASSGGGLQSQNSAYLAAGLLFLGSLGQGPLAGNNAAELNWAVWYLFNQTAVTSSSYWGSLSTGPSGEQAAIEGFASSATTDASSGNYNSLLSDVVVYTPTSWTGDPSEPQEYLGVVPEPASLLLLGSGLLAVAGALRRKLRF